MFYFEDTITQFDVSEFVENVTATEKDPSSEKSEPRTETETPDSPDELLQRIRQVM